MIMFATLEQLSMQVVAHQTLLILQTFCWLICTHLCKLLWAITLLWEYQFSLTMN